MIQVLENPAVRSMAMPMSVEQYHQLSASGIVREETELLRGVVIEKMSKSPLHTFIVQALLEWLLAGVPETYYVRPEQPLTLRDSEPEPDFAVVEGSRNDHRLAHPSTAALIIEVAIASLELDREKASVYAEAGVPEYWIVLPQEKAIEIYTSPTAEGYAKTVRHEDIDVALAPVAFPELSLLPRELFA